MFLIRLLISLISQLKPMSFETVHTSGGTKNLRRLQCCTYMYCGPNSSRGCWWFYPSDRPLSHYKHGHPPPLPCCSLSRFHSHMSFRISSSHVTDSTLRQRRSLLSDKIIAAIGWGWSIWCLGPAVRNCERSSKRFCGTLRCRNCNWVVSRQSTRLPCRGQLSTLGLVCRCIYCNCAMSARSTEFTSIPHVQWLARNPLHVMDMR